jgi:uncharacterized protein (DUF697 family)
MAAKKEKVILEEEKQVPPGNEKVEAIIRQHVGFSMIAGAVPAPVIDIVAITAIQIDMLRQLADAYHVKFEEERGKSIAASLMGATAGTFLGRVGASVVKIVPGIGWLLGIGSQVILAGASTYAIGKVFQAHFSEGGTLFNFDIDAMMKPLREFFEQGKNVAEKMKAEKEATDTEKPAEPESDKEKGEGQ